jgi:hypothetical protein
MNKTCKFAIVIGAGLALIPWVAFAQAPASQPAATSASAPATSAVIPLDQQPTREQLAKLFELMRVRQQVQSLLKIMPAMAQQQMQAQVKATVAKHPECNLSKPENQAAFDKVMSEFMEKAYNIVNIDEMFDDMRVVYQRHVSATDVDALIAFYSSPAGQHLLDAQPVIMKEYMPMVMKRAQERSVALTEELTNDLEQLAKSMASPADKPSVK